jgi:oligopeptidase B
MLLLAVVYGASKMIKLRASLLSLLVLALSPPLARGIDPTVAKPPVAKKEPHKAEIHGDARIDNYYWLRDKKSEAVLSYLKAENAYITAVMKPIEPLQKKLYKEMLGRIKQTDLSVPYLDRGYWYYHRTEEGKQYPVYCRKKGNLEAKEEILLDGNELAKGEKFFKVLELAVSDDGNLLAYATDTSGFREYQLSVKDLKAGKLLENKLAQVTDYAWAADNKTLFYVTEDKAKRPYKLWRHALGQPKDKDVLLFEEKDELFELSVAHSRDRKYLFRMSKSFNSAEQWYLPTAKPAAEWKVILPRKENHEYSADHRDGKFFVRTNWKAKNFKVVTCPLDKTDPASWTELVPYDPKILVTELAVFTHHAVLTEKQDALPQLRVVNLEDKKDHRIVFPEPVYDAFLKANPEFDTATVQLSYNSFVTPPSVYEYNLNTRERKLLKRQEVLGGYDPSRYESQWLHATASDGAKVPISMVRKKGTKKDGAAPLLLYGYGAYGISLTIDFDSNKFSLLDRGVVFAQAHVRGGSDLGRGWYEMGKVFKKKNSFTDFIACADFLVKEKYCARNRLAIHGESAGGMLIGAVLNMRPDLCKAAVLQVPFVDVLNTMLDPDLPLTTQEYEQWGNPSKKPDYEYIKSYCPYTNLGKKAYPSILVMTSLNDSQVMYWEPAKYVAKLRAVKTDANPLLLKVNMAAGHGGASGRYDALEEQAFLMAFVLDQLGIAE